MGERTVRRLVVAEPGHAELVDAKEEPVAAGGFRVDTKFTGLSAGTELTWWRGTNPYLTASWDADLGLFRQDRPGAAYPVTTVGYMEVAQVTASRTPAVEEGALVAMAYGHRTGYTGHPLRDRVTALPPDLDPVLGVYAAHLGPICANGLLHAAADAGASPGVVELGDGVRGRLVLVVGGGPIGLLTGLFAAEHGAAEVVVIDRTPQRLAAARALGLCALDESTADPAVAELLKTRWAHGPGDRGADVVFQCRGQAASLATALRCLRPQGAVIDLAFYPAGSEEVRLGEEFHHNGLTVRCAQIGRVPRGYTATWDRARLSRATLDLLRRHGPAVRSSLVTDVVPLVDAPQLFAELSGHQRQVLTAVFTC